MASTFAVLNLCQAGDRVVSSAQIYGGTFNLFAVSLKKLGIEFTFVDPDADAKTLQRAFRPNTKCVFGETVSNPTGTVLDIAKFAKVAHRNGVPLIVDNTFPTPVLCRPFAFGYGIATYVADAWSCVLHPASHTHRQLSDEQPAAAGIPPDLIRFSVGLEDPADIIADLKQALAKVG